MKLCRFLSTGNQTCVGLSVDGATVLDLTDEGIDRLSSLFEFDGLLGQ